MLKAIAFGLAAGAGIQAWRNWPPDGPVTGDSAAVVLAVAVLCAYLGGRWHGRGRGGAMAFAEAHAEATAVATAQQSVQVAVVMPGAGAGAGMRVPDAAVDWFGGDRRPELLGDQLEGIDLSEFAQEYDDMEEHEAH